MDPIIANALTTPYPRTAASTRPYQPVLTAIVVLGILLGATLMVAAVERLSIGSATAGVAVTDGWAHSPITRGGSTDARAALLRGFAATYVALNSAAEARSR